MIGEGLCLSDEQGKEDSTRRAHSSRRTNVKNKEGRNPLFRDGKQKGLLKSQPAQQMMAEEVRSKHNHGGVVLASLMMQLKWCLPRLIDVWIVN